MRITSMTIGRADAPPATPPGRLPPPSSSARRELLGPWLDDVLLVTEFAGVGQAYKMIGARVEAAEQATPGGPLAGQPRVELSRPFVMVPGWTTRLERFQALGEHLTRDGLNGGEIVFVKNGAFYHDRACSQPMDAKLVSSDHKVFEVLLEDIHEPPPVVADELLKDFNLISQATGAPKLDVDAYSMGGLGTRVYLDRGGDKVGKLLLLGSPQRGNRFAEMSAEIIRRDIGWAMSMAGVTAHDLPALEWLTSEPRNPHLQQLNANWPRQRAQIEDVLSVGGDGVTTPRDGLWPITRGDGLVPVSSLAAPGEKHITVHGPTHHGYLNSNPDVFQAMKDYFGWREIQ